ncbi:MAG TPA: hypothetical protein VF812_10160, partial [Ktedonobacterales bacterium]
MRTCARLSRDLSASLESAALDGPRFSLPGDRPRYAPDRPVDVRHVDIAVTLDFERKRVSGSVTHQFSALFDQVREV